MSLSKLLQLASPTLPVGAYSYSGGLEAAIEAGTVRDAASAERWIGDVLAFSIARMEAPLLLKMMRDPKAWNEIFLASRETAELRAETVQMGYSLNRLLQGPGRGRSTGVGAVFPGGLRLRGHALEDRAGRGAAGLPVGLAREPGDGRGEGRAARARPTGRGSSLALGGGNLGLATEKSSR